MSKKANADMFQKLIEDVNWLCDWAYKMGAHELGYNPVKELQEITTFTGFLMQMVEDGIKVPDEGLTEEERYRWIRGFIVGAVADGVMAYNGEEDEDV